MANIKYIWASEYDGSNYSVQYKVCYRCASDTSSNVWFYVDTFGSLEEAESAIREWMIEDEGAQSMQYQIEEVPEDKEDDEDGFNPHYMTLADIGMRESDF